MLRGLNLKKNDSRTEDVSLVAKCGYFLTETCEDPRIFSRGSTCLTSKITWILFEMPNIGQPLRSCDMILDP